MDAVERLSLEDVRAGTPIAVEHLHRYELAAELCRGLRVADVCCGSGYGSRMLLDAGARSVLGVDNEAETIDEARAALAAPDGPSFERADAVEFLDRELDSDFDAVVMFEGLEHIGDPERALAALARQVKRGIACAVSIPNSRALGEDNPFHVTDFGYRDALAALRAIDEEVLVLHQFAAEGSLIRGPAAGEPAGRFVLPEHGEQVLCNHLIGLVNFDAVKLARLGSAWMQLDVAPLNRRYMRELEAKVDNLWRELGETNRRHATELEAIEGSLSWRITAPLRAAKRRLRSGRHGRDRARG